MEKLFDVKPQNKCNNQQKAQSTSTFLTKRSKNRCVNKGKVSIVLKKNCKNRDIVEIQHEY